MAFQSLSELRKARGGFDKLLTEANKTSDFKKDDDKEGFWAPEVDKAGNGWAVIRFLSAPPGEDMAWVKMYDHGFKGPSGKWYIEKSRSTIGEPDPLMEKNSELWNSGNEALKEQARKQKRRLSYIANIQVVNDPANPDNNGKVFKYKFGKKIFEKAKDMMQPQFPDEAPINPFDFWEGANFKLKIRNVEGYRNYDKSEFDRQSALFDGDDEKIEALWKSLPSLSALVDPSKFKSYDELKKKLDSVLSGATVGGTAADTDLDDDAAFAKAAAAASKTRVTRDEEVAEDKPVKASKAAAKQDDDEDDTVAFFANLANDD